MAESLQPSINTFLNIAVQEPQFKQLPEEVQQSIERREIDNPVDLLADLRLKAAVYLKHGNTAYVKTILEFAQILAQVINDTGVEAQISAWLALLEDHDKEILNDVLDMIQTEVRGSPEFKKFEETVLKRRSQ